MINDTTPRENAQSESPADENVSRVEGRETEAAGSVEAERVAQLEAEQAELKEKLLRSLADMENLRRRADRDVADARVYGVTSFARDMLNVADNIRRALDSIPPEARDALEGPAKSMLEGIELTERDLLKTLERHGVKKLDPQGQKFDPNLHQAMFEVPNPEVPNGTVVQVVQEGYVIADRVLRPALVGVAKGGPKAAPQAKGEEAQPQAAQGEGRS